jgi:hypothetical protein
MKSRFFIGTIFSLFLLSLILFSCSSNDSKESDTGELLKPLAIDENDIAENPDLVITSDHVVVIHLEPPNDISSHDNDTATAGIDRIPIFFPEDVTHDFIVEYQGEEAFVVKLYNQNGDQVALLDKNFNWPAIGASSIDGFRGNWFVRDGILVEKEDRWDLLIEKRPYDLLLGQSPFSFSVISFKWMNKPIFVNWPY